MWVSIGNKIKFQNSRSNGMVLYREQIPRLNEVDFYKNLFPRSNDADGYRKQIPRLNDVGFNRKQNQFPESKVKWYGFVYGTNS